MEQWLPLIGWLAQRRPLHIAAGHAGDHLLRRAAIRCR